MGKVPFRFKRVTDAFDELARFRPCESSGSEHSAEDSAELSDLIDSFMEREGRVLEGGQEDDRGDQKEGSGSESENEHSVWDAKEMLQRFLGRRDASDGVEDDEDDDDDDKRMILVEVIRARRFIETASPEGFKRRLMCQLRERGLDAGLCKSRWQKTGRFPSGDYEYIDVMHNGTRYIVEVDLVGEFTIARPTDEYQTLLDVFPQIFVGKPRELKQVVKLMSNSAKDSLKSRDMHLPPWRKNGYLLAKWFSSYKRTTNATPALICGSGLAGKRSVGFESTPVTFQVCRGQFSRNVRLNLNTSKLAQALEETQ